MNRLLFLAYPFPPSRAIGAVRTWQIAKQLASLGWEVTVVTVDPRLLVNPDPESREAERCSDLGIQVVTTDHELRALTGGFIRPRRPSESRVFAKATRLAAAALAIDIGAGWLRPCLRSCARFMVGEFDLVLATGSPYASFLAASMISKRLRVPYVLDYRDPWSCWLSVNGRQLVRRHIFSLEARLLRGAGGVVMVTDAWARVQEREFGLSRRPFVVSNGYDAELLDSVQAVRFSDFAVVYAGSFYTGQREIGPVLAAVARADTLRPAESMPIRLHYYGPDSRTVAVAAKQMKVEGAVVIHGSVPRKEALSAIKGADATAVITTVHDHGNAIDRGIVTGKLFEALGLQSRVMLIAPHGSEAAAIVEAAGAGRAFQGSQVEAMAKWLLEMHASEPRVAAPHYARRAEYSWAELGARYDTVLRSCLESF